MNFEEKYTRLEALNRARSAILSEHRAVVTKLYTDWQTESEAAWQERREIINFPRLPDYPNNEETIKRAEQMLEINYSIFKPEAVVETVEVATATDVDPETALNRPIESVPEVISESVSTNDSTIPDWVNRRNKNKKR